MSSRPQLRQMTKSELKAWLRSNNQRLPPDDRKKDYYLKRAYTVLQTISNDSDDSSEDIGIKRGRRKSELDNNNTPFNQAIRRARTNIQEGHSSGGSGTSGGGNNTTRKGVISRTSRSRSRRMSTNSINRDNSNSRTNTPSVTRNGAKIVKTRRKTPIRNGSRSGTGTGTGNSSDRSKSRSKSGSRKGITQRKTQLKGSPASVTNSLRKKRGRMRGRRATDDPEILKQISTNYKGEKSDEDTQDETESDQDDNDNVPQYWIDFEPSSRTILQLKQWLTEHNISYPQTSEKKLYYVSLVKKYSKSTKDDSSITSRPQGTKKRGLSPTQKVFVSPPKRSKRQTNLKQQNDSPPLPPNLNTSPLSPPQFRKNSRSPKRNKKGLLDTPAIPPNTTNESMREQVKKLLDSDDDIPGNNNNNDEYEDENENTDSDDIDPIDRLTKINTQKNQILGSRAYEDKIRRKQRLLQKKAQEKVLAEQKKRQQQQQQDRNNRKQIGTGLGNNIGNNNVKRSVESPFGWFGSVVSRLTPSFGGNGKKRSVVSGRIDGVKSKLNKQFNDENMDEAMSPRSRVVRGNNRGGGGNRNNNKNNNNNNRIGVGRGNTVNRIDELTGDDIPVAIKSNNNNQNIRNRKPKGRGVTVGQNNKQNTQNNRNNQYKYPQQQYDRNDKYNRPNEGVEGVVGDDNSNRNVEDKNNANIPVQGKERGIATKLGSLLIVLASIAFAIFLVIKLFSILKDSPLMGGFNEVEWFCDNGISTVNGEKFNDNGIACYQCPINNVNYCKDGRVYCKEHYILSGKKCVLDEKRVQTATQIEKISSDVLAGFKGRRECGENIDDGLREGGLKTHVRNQMSYKNGNEFEDGWNYFISNVARDSNFIEYNGSLQKYYGRLSKRNVMCKIRLFLWDNIIICICGILSLSLILFWVYKHKERQNIDNIARQMHEYTFRLLSEQKLKNPKYKAVVQLKQDNMRYFSSILGKNQYLKDIIWKKVKEIFEADTYVMCSQRSVDGVQQLCWQISDTYTQSSNINQTNIQNQHNRHQPSQLRQQPAQSALNNLNNNLNNNKNVSNVVDGVNGGNNMRPSYPSLRGSYNFMSNIGNAIRTPLFGGSRTQSRLGGQGGQAMIQAQAQGQGSPSNVYGVPIGNNHNIEQSRHSVTSPSRSFGVTPAINRINQRNEESNININNNNNNRSKVNNLNLESPSLTPQIEQQSRMPVYSRNIFRF